MLYCGSYDDRKPESYIGYKNRTVKKHIDKMENQTQQIRSCSLKGEDKERLKRRLIEIINNS